MNCKECEDFIIEEKREEVIGIPFSNHGDYYCGITHKMIERIDVRSETPIWCPKRGELI